jgi:tankyrase
VNQLTNALFQICCERNPDPATQRTHLLNAFEQGADIHATDKNGVTALHYAVRFRSSVAVQTLIEHGANVNQACRKSGSTPLHRAVVQTGAPGTAGKIQQANEIIHLLLAAGASTTIRNKLGKRPSDYVNDPALKSLLK